MVSAIEKLEKYIKLEIKRGYDNKAVVGGLDKVLPAWQVEAEAEGITSDFQTRVSDQIRRYPSLSAENRAILLEELQTCIQKKINQKESVTPTVITRTSTPEAASLTLQVGKKQPPIKQSDPGLDAFVSTFSGIGPATAKKMKELGISTIRDLLYHFPRRYDDFSQLKPINRLNFGEEVTVIGTIKSISTRPLRGGRLKITEAVLADGTGYLRLIWFNREYLEKVIHPEMQLVISGKIEIYLGRMVINNPEWENLEKEHLHTNRIVPIYPLTGDLKQRWLRNVMYKTVNFWAPRFLDYLPDSIRNSAGLMELSAALSQVHFPDSQERLELARHRLAFDEIFLLQLGVLQQKQGWQALSTQQLAVPDEWFSEVVQSVPFQLTTAQNRAIDEIRTDLQSGHPMNRLLQGDVGSGKTILAALAISVVVENKGQAVLMAPTSILAEQHYQTLHTFFKSLRPSAKECLSTNQIRLLIGDTPEKEKKETLAGLQDGLIKVVIGTHALIEDPVNFQNLKMVIIDEQHRFGVKQRAVLRSKGENPHLLVMTATPIPRSLALTVYGDLDLTVLDEMPIGRQPIDTHLINPIERERAYQLIRSQVNLDHQAFIIYPLIEESDREETKAAVEEHTRLQKEVFPTFNLGLLHGRMKQEEKDAVMRSMRENKFDILVSTSVVEVGVDFPNATVMMVEGANRFGLAQLHQFRGRVGRGTEKSYCVLVPETEDSIENERLMAMVRTNDGFLLAEMDLRQRGPGDFLGTRQAGYTNLKLANISDLKLIEKARQQASALFSYDPELGQPENVELRNMIQKYWDDGKGDIS